MRKKIVGIVIIAYHVLDSTFGDASPASNFEIKLLRASKGPFLRLRVISNSDGTVKANIVVSPTIAHVVMICSNQTYALQ